MDRSEHMLDVGPHGTIPANWPPFPQQALLAVENPAFRSCIYVKLLTIIIYSLPRQAMWYNRQHTCGFVIFLNDMGKMFDEMFQRG